MKKLLTSVCTAVFMFLLISSCKSVKGCGLTSDATEIQNNPTTEVVIVAEAK